MSYILVSNKDRRVLFFDIDHFEIVVHIIFRFALNFLRMKM